MPKRSPAASSSVTAPAASARITRAWSARPRRSTLSRSARRAAPSCSTNPADGAPRESASMPTPPAPAKRSRKGPASRNGMSVSRQAMRTWSAVGRVVRPRGVVSRWPLSAPASTLIERSWGGLRLADAAAVALPLLPLPENGVLDTVGQPVLLRGPGGLHQEDHPRGAAPDLGHPDIRVPRLGGCSRLRVIGDGSPPLARPLRLHTLRQPRPARRKTLRSLAPEVIFEGLARAGQLDTLLARSRCLRADRGH